MLSFTKLLYFTCSFTRKHANSTFHKFCYSAADMCHREVKIIPPSIRRARKSRKCVKWSKFTARDPTRAYQYLNVECRPGFPRGFSPNELKFSIEMRIVGIPSSTRWNRLQDNEREAVSLVSSSVSISFTFFSVFFSCVYWNFLTIPRGTTIFLFFNKENSFQQCQTGRFPRITIIIVALTSELLLLLLRRADLEFSIRVQPDSYELYLFRYTSWAKDEKPQAQLQSLSVSFAAGRMCNHVDWLLCQCQAITGYGFEVDYKILMLGHMALCFPKIGWNLIKFASLQSCLYGSWIDWNLHFKGYAMLHHFNQVPSGGSFRNIRLHSLTLREWTKHRSLHFARY